LDYETENNKKDSFALEKAMVKYCHCDKNKPTCLYDFTMKVIMFDHQAFRIPDITYDNCTDVKQDYFYSGADNNHV